MNEHPDEPKFIAHYRVARHLGSGGIGEVFLAKDTRLDGSVALKLLPREVAADASRPAESELPGTSLRTKLWRAR
jgi:serine/threonine-protein kinase